jgi:hypothetical protein
MKLPLILGKEDGFTIQELLVVMIVSSLLIALGLTVFEFGTRLHSIWRVKSGLRTFVDKAAQAIAFDIMRAKELSGLTDSGFALRIHEGREIRYEFRGQTISRDSLKWESDGIRLIAAVKAKPITLKRNPGLVSIGVNGSIRDFDCIAMLEVAPARSSRAELIRAMKEPHHAGRN